MNRTRKALWSTRHTARKTRWIAGAISSHNRLPPIRKARPEMMTLIPTASIGTPRTIAGRVQARNSGSSIRRSSVTRPSCGKRRHGKGQGETKADARRQADEEGRRDQPARDGDRHRACGQAEGERRRHLKRRR